MSLPDIDIESKAQEVINTGGFWEFWMDTYHQKHIGDDTIALEIPCANITPNITNSTGISTIQITGDSGDGKSHGVLMVGKMMGKYCDIQGMSSKFLFYLAKDGLLEPGTVRVLDDNRSDTNQWDLMKRNSTEFKTGYKYGTVMNQKAVNLQLPAGLTFVTTEVNAESEEEVLNRTDPIEVSGDIAKDLEIIEADTRRFRDDQAETDISTKIAICKRCWEIVKSNTYYVVWPKDVNIDWRERDSKGRINHRNRNLMMDLMIAFAAISYKQRDHSMMEDGTIRVVVDKEDFDKARELYRAKSKQVTTKLTEQERRVVNYTARHKRVLKSQAEKDLNIKPNRMSQLLHGKNSNSVKTMGIVDKVIGFRAEYEFEQTEVSSYDDCDQKSAERKSVKNFYLKYEGEPISAEPNDVTWPAQWVKHEHVT